MKTDLEGRRLVGRYLLERPLAAGGMGTIWRAADETLDRAVAVKILHEDLARDPAVFDRFRLEAVAAARLSHPAVVRVFDTGVDEGVCFIVMELLPARPLSEVLERGPLPHAEAVRVALRMLQALGHAHSAGIVHRDVKPANVLVGDDVVKVADFGIAKAAFAGDLTTTGKLLGTAKYLAPEQVEGGEVDGRADLYATGIVLYEMLTGRVPFEAATDLATAMLRLSSEPRPPRSLRAGIPRGLEEIVLRALAREPSERFASADEMAAALSRYGGTRQPERNATAVGVADAVAGDSFFRSWMLVPLVIVVLAAAAVGVGLLVGRLEFGGPLGIRPREQTSAGPSASVLAIAEVRDHDPEGDGAEHPERVALAWDRDASTSWETEGYNSPALGGAKPGVGLVVDLGREREVREVEIRTALTGWRFEVRSSADGETNGPVLRGDDGARTAGARARTRVVLEPTRTRFLVIWIIELVPADGRFRARIAEIRVRGR